MRARTKLQRAHRRLDALARCVVDYHTQQLSQATIADVLDVSQQAISRSLRRTDPDDPEVKRIAALLGVDQSYNQRRLQKCARERADTFYDNRLFRCCFS